VHDVAEGGVATALAEACLAGGVGARVHGLESEEDLFGEGPGAFLVSGPAAALRAFGSAARVIGETGGETLEIDGVLEVGVAELTRAHADGLSVLLR
jgi:phosphoribosylformylglycinamidine synthase